MSTGEPCASSSSAAIYIAHFHDHSDFYGIGFFIQLSLILIISLSCYWSCYQAHGHSSDSQVLTPAEIDRANQRLLAQKKKHGVAAPTSRFQKGEA